MSEKETTELLVEAVQAYLTSFRAKLSPTTGVDILKKIVKLEELEQTLSSRAK